MSNGTSDTRMDPHNLYHEEIFTDRRVGTIQRLTPVTSNGLPDATRVVLYVGQAQMLTPMGALPLTFEIEAQDLEEAARKFAAAAQQAIEQAMEELKELRRGAASPLIIPQAGPGGAGGPGGGKIQLR